MPRRFGRVLSDFGFGQWTDTHYNVEISHPVIRQDSILPSLGLNRLDVGIESHQSILAQTAGAREHDVERCRRTGMDDGLLDRLFNIIS